MDRNSSQFQDAISKRKFRISKAMKKKYSNLFSENYFAPECIKHFLFQDDESICGLNINCPCSFAFSIWGHFEKLV